MYEVQRVMASQQLYYDSNSKVAIYNYCSLLTYLRNVNMPIVRTGEYLQVKLHVWLMYECNWEVGGISVGCKYGDTIIITCMKAGYNNGREWSSVKQMIHWAESSYDAVHRIYQSSDREMALTDSQN